MSQMRLNPLNGRWVTIVPDRQRRPNDFAPRDRRIELDTERPCPFCPGNEEETPPAIETTEADGTWSMRVVPNRYPAFFGDDAFAVHNLGPVHVKAEASGIHEVFVYSPDHFGGLDRLDDAHAAEFMFLLRRRLLEHAALPFVRYTQVIVNHGSEAGASIAHPHGQILGLPFVPGEILDEERAFARFAGGSLLETTIEAELAADQRVVIADDDVVVICPFWSGVPYEMMIVPTERQSHMQHASDRRSPPSAVRSATRSPICRAPSATWRSTSASTPPRTSTPASTTGTCTSGRCSSPRPASSGAPASMINVVPPEEAAQTLRSVRAHA